MDPLREPLSPRLEALDDAIAPGSRVADVGTGHGRLPLRLVASGRAAYCLAIEKTPLLLARVARPAAGAGWADRLGYRAGDGLTAIDAADRIDTVVLAGLGGRTIVRLLGVPGALRASVGLLVLQPRSEHAVVRAWLSRNGFCPVSESLTAERGRLHLTIAARRGPDAGVYGHPTLSREDLLAAGPLLARSRSAEVAAYWRRERDRLESIVARASSGPGRTRAEQSLARAERVIAATSTPAG
jgi:tRNA (adenine22-N1)-methyltransferase